MPDRGRPSDAGSCAHDDSIPPKYAVSQVVGFIKGKSAIHLARVYGERKRNFVGQHFWARGYFVSTVGRDETAIRCDYDEGDDGEVIHLRGRIQTRVRQQGGRAPKEAGQELTS
jgi:hypothetical protein